MDELTRPRAHSMPPPSSQTTSALAVTRTAHRVYETDCEFLQVPRNRANVATYVSDMLKPYGGKLDSDVLDARSGQAYGEMAELLVAAVVQADDPVDLLVLAFAIPDVWPGRATATYLSHVCPGNPLSFAICDQGVASAFTGLRLVREYVTSGASERALLLVVEQPTLHYAVMGEAAVPARASGVALLCERATAAHRESRLESVHVRADVSDERARELFSETTAEYPVPVTVIVGSGVEAPVDAVRAPDGQPYTGIWYQLARAHDDSARAGTVLLADYDRSLRYLCTAGFELY